MSSFTRKDIASSTAIEPEKRSVSYLGGAAPDEDWALLDDPGPAMVAHCQLIANSPSQGWRRTQNLRLARLYQDREIGSIYSTSSVSLTAGFSEVNSSQRSSWNIVRSCVDVAQSRVGRNRGRVMFVSVGGNWSLRRKARLRTRFVDGAFRQANFYAESQKVFLDGTVFGLGILYVYSEHGKLCCERVLPDEIIVDAGQGMNGKPSTIYRCKPIPRTEAFRRFAGEPKDADYGRKCDAIRKAPISTTKIGNDRSVASGDVIDVWMGWKLPSGPKTKDGRYVVAIDGCTISNEPWNRQRFPLVPWRWGDALSGYYGLGIAEQLIGSQLTIRRTLWQYDTALYHGASSTTYVPVGSKVSAKQFNNDPRGKIIFYQGAAPPQTVLPPAVSPELPQRLDREWQHGYDQVGLPQSGSGSVPPSLKSGEAIRAWSENTDSRLAIPSQRWDQYAVDAAEVFLDEVREMDGDVSVEAKQGRNRWQRIDWKEIAEGDSDFVLQAWPSGILPATPSGKYDRLQELVSAGWVTKEEAMAALEIPDLENMVALATSSFEIVAMHLETMLDDCKAEQPEPYQSLDLSLKMAQSAYLMARAQNCPESNLSLVRDYIDALRYLQGQQNPAPPPGAPPDPMAGVPPGDPMAPPPEMPPPEMPPMEAPPNGAPMPPGAMA